MNKTTFLNLNFNEKKKKSNDFLNNTKWYLSLFT